MSKMKEGLYNAHGSPFLQGIWTTSKMTKDWIHLRNTVAKCEDIHRHALGSDSPYAFRLR